MLKQRNIQGIGTRGWGGVGRTPLWSLVQQGRGRKPKGPPGGLEQCHPHWISVAGIKEERHRRVRPQDESPDQAQPGSSGASGSHQKAPDGSVHMDGHSPTEQDFRERAGSTADCPRDSMTAAPCRISASLRVVSPPGQSSSSTRGPQRCLALQQDERLHQGRRRLSLGRVLGKAEVPRDDPGACPSCLKSLALDVTCRRHLHGLNCRRPPAWEDKPRTAAQCLRGPSRLTGSRASPLFAKVSLYFLLQ
ncbi:hypothetical protein H920_19665 [Fukomys damarensis]|uniref:Uncharacterized protein n=1 Tax=Fukomys damarensis TaxID=885580 RepID=A0A091D7V6_FUKDA|nr:hypothetical protein H920_19665 [Fukomys damarensis]